MSGRTAAAWLLAIGATACAVAHARERSLDDLRVYRTAMDYRLIAAACAQRLPALVVPLRAALAGWEQSYAEEIASGRDMDGESNVGAPTAEHRAEFERRHAEPLANDAPGHCAWELRALETGLSLPFNGRSLTDRKIRLAAYLQGQEAYAECGNPASIDAEVLSESADVVSERWVFNGCGADADESIPMRVRYAPTESRVLSVALERTAADTVAGSASADAPQRASALPDRPQGMDCRMALQTLRQAAHAAEDKALRLKSVHERDASAANEMNAIRAAEEYADALLPLTPTEAECGDG